MDIITKICTGCRACENVCPQKSITMVSDKEGFIIPHIDHNTCVDCRLCQDRCPQNGYKSWNTPLAVYAVRDKDGEELYNSASGGAFAVLARKQIEKDGAVVFGAAYANEDLRVEHIAVDKAIGLIKLQSSKYVQSDTLDTFSRVKELLIHGRKVLYSGTPCQISGLKSYLKKDYDNLLTIDLICHGVPSPLLFKKYLDWLSLKMTKVVGYDFRDKSGGWGLDYKAKTKTKTQTGLGVLDPYYYNFLEGNTYRECCYVCRYCRKERVGDITIGDYWGIEKEHPKFFSSKGVSCVLVNTPKGMAAFNDILDSVFYIDSSFEQVARYNGNLSHPTYRKDVRNHIYDGILDKPVNAFFRENLLMPQPLLTRIKSMIPMKMKLMIKKTLVIILRNIC